MGNGSSGMTYAAPKISPARRQHSATLIFLHGLGDDGYSWSDLLGDVVPDYVKVVCPHANEIPVTIAGFSKIPAWFDILGVSPSSLQDEINIKYSTNYLNSLIADEIQAGVPADRVMIGGFSQGGAIALYTAVTTEYKLGGVIALSTWLPMHIRLMYRTANSPVANRETPVLQCHGRDDELLPLKIGLTTSEFLKNKIGLKQLYFVIYDNLDHSTTDQELQDVSEFIKQTIPNARQSAVSHRD